jgi:hypothetical protein
LAEIARLVSATLGFELEFEIPERKTAAMRDDADLTMFLYEGEVAACPGISVHGSSGRCRGQVRRARRSRGVLCSSADESLLGYVPNCMIPTATG